MTELRITGATRVSTLGPYPTYELAFNDPDRRPIGATLMYTFEGGWSLFRLEETISSERPHTLILAAENGEIIFPESGARHFTLRRERPAKKK